MKNAFLNWRRVSLGGKLALSNFLLVAVASTLCVIAISYSIAQLVEEKVIADVSEKTQLLTKMVERTDHDLHNRAAQTARAFQANIQGTFELSSSTMDIKGTVTPVLMRDGKPVNLDFDLVDRFTRMTGATAAVFAKTGDDFVLVTASLTNEKGERAVGTVLGRNHPGYQAMHRGNGYIGLVDLFGRPYMTQYDPIVDAQGQTIGLSFIGLEFSELLGDLKDSIRDLKLGKTGYFYVLDAHNDENYGKLIIHPSQEGKNILGSKDSNGREFIREILERKNRLIRYPWINKGLGEVVARDKVAAFVHLENWNWVVGGGTYVDEYSAEIAQRRNTYALAGLVTMLVISGIWWLAIRRMVTAPMGIVTTVAKKVAQGDLSTAVASDRQDEIGHLVNAMKTMESVLVNFQKEQAEMARQHDLGMIDYCMPAGELPGVYGEIAHSINTIVRSHIAIKMKVVEIVTAYTEGRFDVMMDRLPGQKARITEAMDKVQAAMRSAAESAEFNERIRMSLDTVCVTVSNAQALLVHASPSAKEILMHFGGDDFDTEKFYGNKLSSLFKDPRHATQFDQAIRTGQITDMEVQGHQLRLVARPMYNDHGQPMGHITQWIDRTDDLAAENDLDIMISAATQGDFSGRMRLDNKIGLFARIAGSMNLLMLISEQGLEDVARVMQAIANGDLTQHITRRYQGLFGKVADSVNTTSDNLNRVIGEVRGAANQLNATAQAISQSVSKQATSVNESIAQIETMSVSTNPNNDNEIDNVKITDSMATSEELMRQAAQLQSSIAFFNTRKEMPHAMPAIERRANAKRFMAEPVHKPFMEVPVRHGDTGIFMTY